MSFLLRSRRPTLLVSTIALAAGLAASVPAAALACGGGFTEEGAELEVDQHVAFYSIRADGTTDVVIELAVPGATGKFGVVLPVTGVPVLDDEPVSAEELALVDQATTPRLVSESGDGASADPGGCGCGSEGDLEGGGDDGGEDDGGVQVLDVAEIGPVTAVSFAADDPDALDGWLEDRGFVVAPEAKALLDSYAAAGKTFIAFERSDDAPAGATSIGIHFTVPGAYEDYPLRLAALGASEQIGIRVYLANGPGPLGPAAPFATLGLSDLDASVARNDSYTAAVTRAVAEHAGKAFVVEGVFSNEGAAWRDALGPRLQSMTDANATLTRLTTIVDAGTLTEDVVFREPISREYPTEIDITSASLGSPRPRPVSWGAVGIFAGTVATSIARRRRRP